MEGGEDGVWDEEEEEEVGGRLSDVCSNVMLCYGTSTDGCTPWTCILGI